MSQTTSAQPLLKRALAPPFRFLASLQLAVTLLLTLAAVLAVATVLETQHGAPYAHWHVYESSWFCGLLALLGVNIFCAAAIRFPWKRHQTGFVITHAGLLILLAGSVQTFLGGLEGQVSLVEGEQASDASIPRRSRITASWVGKPREAPYDFTFEGGPAAWGAGKTFDVGEVDGVGVRILRFYPQATPRVEWVADESDGGRPVVDFELLGPDGKAVARHWLADEEIGDEVFVGPLLLRLQRAASDRMLEEFLEPPQKDDEELGEQGLLTVYYQDAVERIAVQENVGQKTTLGTTGASVEIAEYLPNAHPDKLARFSSKGEVPKNPMVELRVYLSGEDEPQRQIAFAKNPLLNLDGVYSRACPVKFVYHHPKVTPQASVEFLQTSDGKLHVRECAGGSYTSRGTISAGDRLALAGNFQLVVQRYLSHGRRKVTFEPTAAAVDGQEKTEPAALVEVRAGGVTRRAWMQRNHVEHSRAMVNTPQGALQLSYGYGRVPLGYSVKLVDFRRDVNPGGVGNAAFSSKLQLVAEDGQLDSEREVSMNEPLAVGRFTLYQSGFSEAGHGREAATFTVAYDPGRPFKYLGSLMICAGIAIMFYMRDYFKKRPPAGQEGQQESTDAERTGGDTVAGASHVPPPKLLTATRRAAVTASPDSKSNHDETETSV